MLLTLAHVEVIQTVDVVTVDDDANTSTRRSDTTVTVDAANTSTRRSDTTVTVDAANTYSY